MPATLKHIQTNFGRIAESENPDLIKLLDEARAEAERLTTPEQVEGEEAAPAVAASVEQLTWKLFVESADKAKIADAIPGSVGRAYAKQYGKVAARPARGARVEIQLSDAAKAAVLRLRKDSDQLKVDEETGVLSFTNRRGAVQALEAMIARNKRDIDTPAKSLAGERTAIGSLLKKIDV
jgi:hypothetical protein